MFVGVDGELQPLRVITVSVLRAELVVFFGQVDDPRM